ncbi:MAG: hypothetical protein CMJ25_13660 [Phycisphaerae bacterium]|nr:hypothetical protein [Phycisphaerae bacterium]|tara:strand:- start:3687 stop:4406 length:720 start_codon:yes stop_codon:yes gene_type:complete
MILKIDIVLAAYEELRISGLTSEPSPKEVESAVRRLDNMMLGWKNKNLCLSYIRSESYSDIDPNQDSGINDVDMFAIVANLAKNLCAMFGKTCHIQTMIDAKEGYDNLFSAVVPERESDPYQPLGSGRPFGNTFASRFKYQGNNKNAPDNCETLDLIVGQTDYFSVDFNRYLLEGNTIDSYTIDDGQGVEVIESTESEGFINFEAKGLAVGFAPIKITVTSTPSGRVIPETINFNVTES